MQKRLIAGAVAAISLVVAAPACASNPQGRASSGAADFGNGAQKATIAPLAVCDVNPEQAGTVTGASAAVSQNGLKIGATSSTCTTTMVNEAEFITTTRSQAKGSGFELSALLAQKGPRLKIGEWTITCDADQKGTQAGWELKGMSGWTGLPQQIPAGYVHDIKAGNGTVLAKAKFTDTVFPQPNDGSLSMTLLRLTFEPASGYSGTITVGTTACSPTL